MSCSCLLRSVNDTCQLASDHQVPWGLLMRSLGELGVGCVAPIFNYLPVKRATTGGRGTTRQAPRFEVDRLAVEGPGNTSSVEWKSHELTVIDDGKDLAISVNYLPSKYPQEVIRRFVNTFVRCLELITDDPTRLVADVLRAIG
jgi:hypothetical protein